MTSPPTIGTEVQSVNGRSVRDIVETSPELVSEVWCRKIFRQILQSLELQYAMHLPHRAITADTIVFHENGEPLLLPAVDGEPAHGETDDLFALAAIIHYAITLELVPTGPLRGRALPQYSESLLSAVDRCMADDPAQRPPSIDALREILGIVAPGALASSAGGARRAAAMAAAEAAAAVPAPDLRAEPASAMGETARSLPDAQGASAGEPFTAAGARPGAGAGRWQRWAIGLGGGAALLAIALAMFAGLRDSGTFDHIVLTLPQGGDAARDGKAAVLAQTPAPTRAGAQAPTAAGTGTSEGGATASGGQSGLANGGLPDSGVAAEPATAGIAGAATPGPLAQAAVPDPSAPITGTQPDSAAPAQAPEAFSPRASKAGGAAANGGASLRFRIQPWGVIYVDGVDRGVSPPVKRLRLAPGRHILRIANPAFQERVLEVDTSRGGGLIAVDFNKGAR